MGVVTKVMCMCVTYLDCWRYCGVGDERLLKIVFRWLVYVWVDCVQPDGWYM